MFNQIVIKYSADSAVKAGITYECNGEIIHDGIYLDAAENGIFSMLIQGALEGKTAKNDQVEVDSSVKIQEVTTGMVELSEEAWIEKDGLRLGITLEMGGAISSLVDKNAPEGYTNLLNRFDTGRLIQQSYYGCDTPPYEKGEFMGSSWPYNPVQGGDKGNFRSRIIAYTRTDKEIYIKAQPYDWGHVGKITPSYMENWYSFMDNGVILVKNRFTDYSGLSHSIRSQELPAFYVVSALDIFTWEDEGVQNSRDDMIFWPDASDQNFILKKPDQAFCIWHDESGYGVGLAVPGVEQYYAGRYMHNDSKDPYDAGTNYVAPLQQIKLRSYVPFTYQYLLAAGTVTQVAVQFRESLKAIDNRSMADYGQER